MLPMLPMALTMAMAAAFFAAGRGMVLEIQASITKPEAKPAVPSQKDTFTIRWNLKLTGHQKHGKVARASTLGGHGNDVADNTSGLSNY